MKTFSPLMVALVAAAVATTPFAAKAVPIVADASFESPAAGPAGYTYAPTGSPWTYSANNTGISANGGPFYSGSAPDGVQAAFIQSNNGMRAGGFISQTISGLEIGRVYNIVFSIASRAGYGTNPVDVTFGGIDLGTYSNSGLAFVKQTSTNYTATTTSALLQFAGTNMVGPDNDVALDAVSINQVPEPASMALLGLGVAAVTFARRRKVA